MNNDWVFCEDYQQNGLIIETQTLWGEGICRVWLPGADAIVRIPQSRLRQLEERGAELPESIMCTVAAARIAELLTQDVLLAPMEAPVIPLPHQLQVLSKAVNSDRVRFLLADEVGLGKTIEAGLILRELKLRGLVKRTLIVAPAGLVPQWQLEMRNHFNESFTELQPGSFTPYHLSYPNENVWQFYNQMICSLDSVKPMEQRKGWEQDRVDDYNRWRYYDLISAGWDLVIIDEAHRLGGSSEQVARHRLGVGLSEAAPYLLLLSATPHQGKTDAFHRLVSLLDARAFPDPDSVTRERLKPYVIRTEKRKAIDADGHPLFKPRRTELSPVTWLERHQEQQTLYKAVSEYVRAGYSRAMKEKRGYDTFLLILMQRLVVSSTKAVRATLEKRLDILSAPAEQGGLFPDIPEDEWADLDGQAQLDAFLSRRLALHQNEQQEVERLLDTATRCEQTGPDAKAEALLSWIYRLQSESGDPDLKVLVFTEFVPTQEMLRKFLEDRGFSVVCLNGSLSIKERRRVQEKFAGEMRILLSTDAGGEGLNLQFCHVVINYDIPWNPMRLEQRIGRVDRIGQAHTVRAINFVFENSVEHRVREVLEQKLAIIHDEFGVDKTEDVLMSSPAGQVFDEIYIDALLHPEQVESSVEHALEQWRHEVEATKENSSLLGSVQNLDPDAAKRLRAHPLPHWVERMTTSFITANGGEAKHGRQGWRLRWPDGEVYENAVFTLQEAEAHPSSLQLSLEDPNIRGIVTRLPQFVPGQPIPVVAISGLSSQIRGDWSLWRIGLGAAEGGHRRIMALFMDEQQKVLLPTARQVWEQLLVADVTVSSRLDASSSAQKLEQMTIVAEEHGKSIYEALAREHVTSLNRERDKNDYAFTARRNIIQRIGLPEVRNHRLKLLEEEERLANADLDRRALVAPELTPIIMLRVEGKING